MTKAEAAKHEQQWIERVQANWRPVSAAPSVSEIKRVMDSPPFKLKVWYDDEARPDQS